MDNDNAIIQLLTEIRDNQREESAWRKKVIEESVRLQRVAVRWQRIALVAAGLLIIGGVSIAFWGRQLFGG